MISPIDAGTIFEIELIASAIAELNSSHRQLAFGGSLTTLVKQPNVETVFSGSGNMFDIAELRLTFVPEPIGFGIFNLRLLHSRGFLVLVFMDSLHVWGIVLVFIRGFC